MQGQRSEYILFKEEPGKVCMYMLHDLTVATLLLPPQTTLDVCHMCKKKITERVSDKTRGGSIGAAGAAMAAPLFS